ncbi:MAG: hypothetical protein RR422_05300, partial [Erysipelothrix sp.]
DLSENEGQEKSRFNFNKFLESENSYSFDDSKIDLVINIILESKKLDLTYWSRNSYFNSIFFDKSTAIYTLNVIESFGDKLFSRKYKSLLKLVEMIGKRWANDEEITNKIRVLSDDTRYLKKKRIVIGSIIILALAIVILYMQLNAPKIKNDNSAKIQETHSDFMSKINQRNFEYKDVSTTEEVFRFSFRDNGTIEIMRVKDWDNASHNFYEIIEKESFETLQISQDKVMFKIDLASDLERGFQEKKVVIQVSYKEKMIAVYDCEEYARLMKKEIPLSEISQKLEPLTELESKSGKRYQFPVETELQKMRNIRHKLSLDSNPENSSYNKLTDQEKEKLKDEYNELEKGLNE